VEEDEDANTKAVAGVAVRLGVKSAYSFMRLVRRLQEERQRTLAMDLFGSTQGPYLRGLGGCRGSRSSGILQQR